MRAVAYRHARPVSAEDALIDVDIDRPEAGPRDLLVKVEAVSVNPVDTKVRRGNDPGGSVKVLGFDAAGTVEAVGAEVTLFRPGDQVWYAGSIARPGCDAEYHTVDERIVGAKPASLDFAEAAALPLTALTAWELLFDRIGVKQGADADDRSLLIVGGAGGVGSIAIQLARALTGLTVIATASRMETVEWVRELGAHHVVDHSKPLQPQLAVLGFTSVDIITPFVGTRAHAAELAEIVSPEGHIGMIEGDGPTGLEAADFGKLFSKAAALHLELMFVRPRGGATMIRQHEILSEVAALVDAGKIRSTMTKRLAPINAATLREAHEAVESGHTIGKVVVAGWPDQLRACVGRRRRSRESSSCLESHRRIRMHLVKGLVAAAILLAAAPVAAQPAAARADRVRVLTDISHELGVSSQQFVACFRGAKGAYAGTEPGAEREQVRNEVVLPCLQKANPAITGESFGAVIDRYRLLVPTAGG